MVICEILTKIILVTGVTEWVSKVSCIVYRISEIGLPFQNIESRFVDFFTTNDSKAMLAYQEKKIRAAIELQSLFF